MIEHRDCMSKRTVTAILCRYRWNILAITILSIFSIYIGPDHAVALRYDILRFICSIVFIFTFLYFFRARGKFGWLVGMLILVVLSLQLGYRFNFGERIPKSVLAAIVETNWHEAQGMLGDLPGMFVFSAIVFLVCISLFLRIEVVKNKLIDIFLVCSCFLLLVVPIIWNTIESDRFVTDVTMDPQVVGRIYYDMNNLFFGDVAYLTATMMLDHLYKKNIKKEMNPYVLKNNEGVKNVVLVIGESSVSNRYSAYGYRLKTSPNIDANLLDDAACLVRDVHSSAPITRDSISMSLSFATPEDSGPLFREYSIIDMAKINGYKTHWLSAQPLKGRYETRYGFLVKESDVVELTDWNDDELPVLLKRLFSKTKEIGKRNFIAIQMNGSHVPYANKFDPEDDIALPGAEDYDKSIRKTDRIVSEILKIVETNSDDYAFVFFSDHGEIVNIGHGMSYGGKEQYMIPMFIKSNSKNSDICSFVKKLRNKNGYVNGLSNKFILSRLLGYSIDQSYLKREVENDRILNSNGMILGWEDVLLMKNAKKALLQ